MLIGICGRAGSGKSTIADHLCLSHSFIRQKFASDLKAGIRTAFHLDERHTDGEMKEDPLDVLNGNSTRDVMEWFGEGARQRFGPDIWVKTAMARAARNAKLGHGIVFDDVRNLNEAMAIRNAGGVIVRIFRTGADSVPLKESEAGIHLILGDFTYNNTGTMSDLRLWVDAALVKLKAEA